MGTVVSFEGRHDLSVRSLPMDDSTEIGERLTKGLVQPSGTGLVGRHVGLRCMVEEVIRKKLFEHIKVSFTLHFLGISANHRFSRFARLVIAHSILLQSDINEFTKAVFIAEGFSDPSTADRHRYRQLRDGPRSVSSKRTKLSAARRRNCEAAPAKGHTMPGPALPRAGLARSAYDAFGQAEVVGRVHVLAQCEKNIACGGVNFGQIPRGAN